MQISFKSNNYLDLGLIVVEDHSSDLVAGLLKYLTLFYNICA